MDIGTNQVAVEFKGDVREDEGIWRIVDNAVGNDVIDPYSCA